MVMAQSEPNRRTALVVEDASDYLLLKVAKASPPAAALAFDLASTSDVYHDVLVVSPVQLVGDDFVRTYLPWEVA